VTDFQGNPELVASGISATILQAAGQHFPVATEVLGRADAQLFEGGAVRRSRLPLETIKEEGWSGRRQRDGVHPIR